MASSRNQMSVLIHEACAFKSRITTVAEERDGRRVEERACGAGRLLTVTVTLFLLGNKTLNILHLYQVSYFCFLMQLTTFTSVPRQISFVSLSTMATIPE